MKTHTGRERWAVVGALVLSMGLLSSAQSIDGGTDNEQGDVEDVRSVLEKWVETRRVISKERRDWRLGRQVLEDRIRLVKREIEALRTRIGEAEASIAEADEKRAGLVEENEQLKRSSAALDGTVEELERRTTELLARVPDPVRERVRPLSQRFPEDPDETKLSLAQRFQNVVGVLNEVNKAHREVTVASEVRTIRGGLTAEVAAIYLGIGQGYYVSTNGDAAGVGSSSADGWTWTPADDAAAEIARAIAILKNEQIAEFVRLPIRID